VARDLDAHRQEIQLMLEQEIVSAYYYQGGQLQIGLRTDKTIAEAERILNEEGVYKQTINGGEKNIGTDSSMKSGE
jgi:carboxyl-terminal processing protease